MKNCDLKASVLCGDWKPQLNLEIPETYYTHKGTYIIYIFLYIKLAWSIKNPFVNFAWIALGESVSLSLSLFRTHALRWQWCSSGSRSAKCSSIIIIIISMLFSLATRRFTFNSSAAIRLLFSTGAANLNFISGNLLNLLRFLMTRLFYGNDMCVCVPMVTGQAGVLARQEQRMPRLVAARCWHSLKFMSCCCSIIKRKYINK